MLALWVLGQALWLQQGYQLEFLGRSTFVPGLWLASLLLFGVNCWILGIVVGDVVGGMAGGTERRGEVAAKTKKDGPMSGLKDSRDGLRREDVKASVSGTSIGKANLAPRGKTLRSQAL